jgi:hypothetical protein
VRGGQDVLARTDQGGEVGPVLLVRRLGERGERRHVRPVPGYAAPSFCEVGVRPGERSQHSVVQDVFHHVGKNHIAKRSVPAADVISVDVVRSDPVGEAQQRRPGVAAEPGSGVPRRG